MKVLKNGKYFGIFSVTCDFCGCTYEVTGPDEIIFSDESDYIILHVAGDTLVSTNHYGYTKFPECSYRQRFAI